MKTEEASPTFRIPAELRLAHGGSLDSLRSEVILDSPTARLAAVAAGSGSGL
jgi:hypothetical protein